MKQLRHDQLSALAEVEEAIESGLRRILMLAPTGYGKTLTATALIKKYLEEGKRVAFVVPALSLIAQSVEVFHKEGIDHIGVMQGENLLTDWFAPLQVCSTQTLNRRVLPKADIVIVDEIHQWFRLYEKWFLDPEWKDIPFIGLSATPWTKGLGNYFQLLVVAMTISEAIDQGILSRFKVFAPAHPDLRGVRTRGGDYDESDLEKVMNQKRLIADLVSTYQQRANGLPAFCFCTSVAHAKDVQRQFNEAGIPCGFQDAHTKDNDRKELKRAFHAGEIKVVASVGTLILGVDWDVRCLIWARPTKSEILYVQGTGRGLRTAESKDHLVILDHADNTLRLGFVTDIGHPQLNTGKKPLAASVSPIRLPKECPQCSFLKPPKTLECPNCGFATKPIVDVVVEKGELVEFTKKDKQKELFDKEEAYAGLLWWGRQKGFKHGWSAFKYKELFGEWPDNLQVNPKEPTIKLYRWIKHRQIAWVKGKGRNAAPE